MENVLASCNHQTSVSYNVKTYEKKLATTKRAKKKNRFNVNKPQINTALIQTINQETV